MARKMKKTTGPTVPSTTKFLEFSANREFSFHAGNASPQSKQQGRKREHYFTTSSQFARRGIAANPQVFTIHDQGVQIPCLDPAVWAKTDFQNTRVLFLLPSQALGNNVCIWFFLQAFLEQQQLRSLGVCCTESSSDIFLLEKAFKIHGLWVSQKQFGLWDYVIDLGHLESRRNIDLWPIDMEAELLNAFELTPSARFSGKARAPTTNGPPRIGLFPMASSPLRTLPPECVQALIVSLADVGDVTLCSNSFQQQGKLLLSALDPRQLATIEVVENFPSIGAILQAIKDFDYVVMADSGPAHMTKLFGTPGMAVYTSAPGDVLQGRFTNMRSWTVPYKGEYCAAPCGLAKVRQSAAGDIGCMGSLQLSVEELPTTPSGQNVGLVKSLFENPVPCVAALAADASGLLRDIQSDLHRLGLVT